MVYKVYFFLRRVDLGILLIIIRTYDEKLFEALSVIETYETASITVLKYECYGNMHKF